MTAFDMAVQALFGDPNIAEAALWRVGGVGPGRAISVIRTQPEPEFDIGGVKLSHEGTLFDVPTGIAPTIDENDTIETAGIVYVIQAPPVRTMDCRIWRLDVRPT